MKVILSDSTKFKHLGGADKFDSTDKVESKIQRDLLKLVKRKELSRQVYESIRPSGSQRPRLYGLPKTHKENQPLRPILSMVNSATHKLSQWLCQVLQPVLADFSTYCVKDSFTFAKAMQETYLSSSQSVLCSFDIKSLFTNVPLDETISICADHLYHHHPNNTQLKKNNFVELLRVATTSVEFSFNDEMYKQTDGVAMGSPLGPILANIFVGFQESKLFSKVKPPTMYCRYVDDCFAIFDNQTDCDSFYKSLNNSHPSLQYTCEKEQDGELPFLDVKVIRNNLTLETMVYRKPTFSGDYVKWDSFCGKKRKINLIKTLVHRGKMICSPKHLPQELKNIRSIFIENGYPVSVVDGTINRKIQNYARDALFGPSKYPVYMKLPYIGPISANFEKRIRSAVEGCLPAIQTRTVFTSQPMLKSMRKDVLPTTSKSMVNYKFTCVCGVHIIRNRFFSKPSRYWRFWCEIYR